MGNKNQISHAEEFQVIYGGPALPGGGHVSLLLMCGLHTATSFQREQYGRGASNITHTTSARGSTPTSLFINHVGSLYL